MIRKILTFPDDRLKRKASQVNRLTFEIIDLVNDLVDTMRDANGAGLAATQIGVLKSVLVMERDPDPLVLILSIEKMERWQSWFNAPVLKTDVGETPPWVRIPPSPPYTKKTKRKTK